MNGVVLRPRRVLEEFYPLGETGGAGTVGPVDGSVSARALVLDILVLRDSRCRSQEAQRANA